MKVKTIQQIRMRRLPPCLDAIWHNISEADKVENGRVSRGAE